MLCACNALKCFLICVRETARAEAAHHVKSYKAGIFHEERALEEVLRAAVLLQGAAL